MKTEGRGRVIALGALACVALIAVLSWRSLAIEYRRWELARDPSLFRAMAVEAPGSISRMAVGRYLQSDQGQTVLLDTVLRYASGGYFGQYSRLQSALVFEVGYDSTYDTVSISGNPLIFPRTGSSSPNPIVVEYVRHAANYSPEGDLPYFWKLLEALPDHEISSTMCPTFRFQLSRHAESETAKPSVLRARRCVLRSLDDIRPDLTKIRQPERVLALHDLAELGTEAAAVMPELIQALKDRSSHAERVLMGLGEAALSPLLALFSDEDPEAFWIAAHLFADSDRLRPLALPRLVALLSDENPAIRSRAVQAVGRMEAWAKPALPRLKALLTDPDPVVRRHAANAIDRIEKRERPSKLREP